MHRDRRGKADRQARQALALALLRVPLARLGLISREMTRGGTGAGQAFWRLLSA
jgi:hypothetical protein